MTILILMGINIRLATIFNAIRGEERAKSFETCTRCVHFCDVVRDYRLTISDCLRDGGEAGVHPRSGELDCVRRRDLDTCQAGDAQIGKVRD